ncbi:ABC transporter ATP-binding protein [Ammoniphilus sp. YIM 78166]|uniref:ABC transporter ATP-binding protein n=1 Tax=Ammoniphilus sp. YIM 78166 TaxID=1644106 RepID=UPI00106FECA8|nr:ABC transporter ATP-binding protein [Ammoniphilus sp. YIM 78166]
MADLVIKDLYKRYNENEPPVVRGVSLDLEGGELVSFLGPSGCGKTTILRMIAGLLMPDQGSISIQGKEVANLPAYKRDIGMVFQNYALFPHMTVAENVAFGLKMRKQNGNRSEMKDQVAKALGMVNMSAFHERYPKQLSGGQQQRVALARALVLKPAVLLLDEPLSALDAKLRHETREEIRRLQQELGLATVFVTHDQEEAMAVSDKVVVLSHGIVQQYDEPQNIFERPVNEFVARFMGVPNVYPVVSEENGRYVTTDGLQVLADRILMGISAIGVRPERVQIVSGSATPEQTNKFQAVIKKRSYSGTMVKFELQMKNGSPIVSMIPSYTEAARLKEGENVFVYWAPSDTLLLLPEKKNEGEL